MPRGRPKGTGTGIGTGTGKKKRKYTITTKVIMRNKKTMGMLPAETDEEKIYNARVLEHSLRTYEISKQADINDPESLKSCFINYVQMCAQTGMKLGNLGACTAMGINIRTLELWANGSRRASQPEYKQLAEFVGNVCSMTREQMVSDGKLNPIIGIFWQRNFDGLRNDTENALPTISSDEMGNSSPKYIEKYGHLLDE